MITRYEYQPGQAIWPINFAYASEDQVLVNLVLPTGIEKRLAQGRDYIIESGCVVFVLPKDCALLIIEDEAKPAPAFQAQALTRLAAARQAAQISTLAEDGPDPVGEEPETSAEPARETAQAAANDSRIAALEAKIRDLDKQRLAALEAERQKACDLQIGAVEQAGQNSLQALEETANRALAQIDSVSRNSGKAVLTGIAEAAQSAEQAAEKAKTVARQTETSANDSQERLEKLITALDQRINELENRADKAAQSAETRMAAASLNAQAEVQAQARSLALENARASRLAGQAWPAQGWMIQEEDLAPRSVMSLPDPLAYYPGRNSLFIARNGFLMACGRDYEEVGSGTSISNTIRLLTAANAGDLWAFVILPTNAAQAASEHAKKAESAAHEAATCAASASGYVKTAQEASNNAATEAQKKLLEITAQAQNALKAIRESGDAALKSLTDQHGKMQAEAAKLQTGVTAQIRKEGEASSEKARKLWRDAELGIAAAREDAQTKAQAAVERSGQFASEAGSSAANARREADSAWEAAFQASIDRAQPGIASVTGMDELKRAISGVYILNPFIGSRTPFMGIYPIEKLADANFDGVFFIGPPYPDAPKLPDKPLPEHPEPEPVPDNAKAASDWLPCGHTHQ